MTTQSDRARARIQALRAQTAELLQIAKAQGATVLSGLAYLATERDRETKLTASHAERKDQTVQKGREE